MVKSNIEQSGLRQENPAASLETGLAQVILAPRPDTVFVVPPEERRMVGSEIIGRQVELNIGRAVVAPIYLLDKYAE